MLHVETRCPVDPNAVDALYPGDLDRLFERIVNSAEYAKYEPEVVSRPPDGPWMIIFENMLNELECERVIELGTNRGYERSAVSQEVCCDVALLFFFQNSLQPNCTCMSLQLVIDSSPTRMLVMKRLMVAMQRRPILVEHRPIVGALTNATRTLLLRG